MASTHQQNVITLNASMTNANAPIGIFDSGLGGLSVLRHIAAQLPKEHLLYFADSGFAPYGEKSTSWLIERSLAIADFFMQQNVKALVVACNTATAAAIKVLRVRYPDLVLIGVEPGLKPAATLTHSKIVGVLATECTLSSEKFTQLRQQISAASQVTFLPQACIGLADQVEKGELDSPTTIALLQTYIAPLIQQGADTLVLGCTHYPFLQTLIEEIAQQHQGQNQPAIHIVDTGASVARHLTRLLTENNLQRNNDAPIKLEAYTSGNKAVLENAFSTLLQLHPPVTATSPAK